MKKIILLFLTTSLQHFSQEFFPNNFTGSITPPTTPWTICAGKPSPLPTATPNEITFNVSGVGILNNTTNGLYRINFDFTTAYGCGTYGSSKPNVDNDLQLLLVLPSGTCAIIYNAGWNSARPISGYGDLTNNNAIVELSSLGCGTGLCNPTGVNTNDSNFNNSTSS